MACIHFVLLVLSVAIATVVAYQETKISTTIGNGKNLTAFLKEAAANGIINEDQVNDLLQLAREIKVPLDALAAAEVDESAGIFMRMYNQLTLLNVLYFAGSLLIIGAYTLLMTLAWSHFNRTMLTCAVVGQFSFCGIMGTLLWSTSYQFLGGLLCTISTGLVPYSVYCIEKLFDVWPKEDPGEFQGFRLYIRPGWVAMEIATVVVGMFYLVVAPFPFLLAPVSFSLWFLSMDLAPLLSKWDDENMYHFRRYISLVFGLALIGSGRFMEIWMGAEPDFGFWLYLFGLITFWFALTLHPESENSLLLSLYFLINICLVLIGSHLNRSTFYLFGTIGVSISSMIFIAKKGKGQKSMMFWLLKALATVSLLTRAIKTGGSIEIINAVICFTAFNMESVLFISSNVACLFAMLTNVGFSAVVPSLNQPVSFWIFDIDSAEPYLKLFSLSILLFHFPVIKYYNDRNSQHNAAFLIYHGILSLCISLVLAFIQQPVWVAGIGLPLIAMTKYQVSTKYLSSLHKFILLFFSIILSIILQSNMLYLVSCGCMLYWIMNFMQHGKNLEILGCSYAITLILLSIPLQSKFMITIGSVYVFSYLSYLAYEKFKNSLIFPLVLIGLGVILIFMGTVYQQYQDSIYEATVKRLPNFFSQCINEGIDFNLYYYFNEASFSLSSIWRSNILWIFWSGMMVHALVKEPLPYVSYACGAGILLILIGAVYLRAIEKRCIDWTSKITISSLSVSLNQSGTKDGFIIKFSGTKPSNLIQPKYISLTILGDQFWRAMSNQFGNFVVSVARSAFLPYQLSPSIITLNDFKKGSTRFTAIIELGTRKPAIGRGTIVNNVHKVKTSSSKMTCALLYSNSIFHPFSNLCQYEIEISEVCAMILSSEN